MKYYAIHYEDYIKEVIDEELGIYGDKIVSNQGWIYGTIFETKAEAQNELLEDGFIKINDDFFISDAKEVRYEATINTVKVAIK